MNTTKILQERIRVAFAPGEPSFVPAASNAPARLSSDECRILDLPQRIAVVRNNMSGRIVFTTSFGIEDQAIAHAIFSQAIAIDVVTLDTGRLFSGNLRALGQDRAPIWSTHSCILSGSRRCRVPCRQPGHQRILHLGRGPENVLRGPQGGTAPACTCRSHRVDYRHARRSIG